MYKRHTAALRSAAAGTLAATGTTAIVALALIAARPFLVSSPILREALLRTLAAMALAGLIGGFSAGLLSPRSRWSGGTGACALLGALVAATYLWSGWDGQAQGLILRSGPLLWSARLPGLAAILAAAAAGGLAFRMAAATLLDRRPRLQWIVPAVGLVLIAAATVLGTALPSRTDKNGIVLFGVDGVDLELLRIMIRRTDLPHLERLLNERPYGDLLPEPPYSPPSWTTLATGKLPEKHGIDNWGRNNRATGKRDRYTRSHIDALTLFDIAEEKGLGGAVFEWPIVGRESDGLDSPVNRAAVFLTGFGERLPWMLRQALHTTASKRDRVHLSYAENETGLVVLAHFFWNHSAARVFGLVVKSTDSSQHHYFHSLDPGRFGLDPKTAHRDAMRIERIYRIADRILGGFMVDPATNVLVFSDHGHQAIPADRVIHFNYAYSFRIAPLLETWGFLVRDETGKTDLTKSRLYDCSDKVLHQQICVNTTNVRARALGVESAALLERGRADIDEAIRRFRSLEFEDDGTPLFPGRYTTRWSGRGVRESWIQEVDEGRGSVFFPNFDDYDLILGQGFEVVPFSKALESRFVVDDQGMRWPIVDLLASRGWEGNHRRDGFVAGWGPAFGDTGRIEGARTVDIVPTALHILGLPQAADLDGRVLGSMLRHGFHGSSPAPVATYEGSVRRGRHRGDSSFDERLQRDIKTLGYIE